MKSGIRKTTRPGAYRYVAGREPALVLIVDDYDDTRAMYAEFLEFAGFRIAEAGTGGHAITTVHERKPALVVMDLSLPDMSGSHATRILRRDVRTMDIPIIAVTAYASSDARDIALSAGCDLFLEKPVAPNELTERIERLLLTRRNGGTS